MFKMPHMVKIPCSWCVDTYSCVPFGEVFASQWLLGYQVATWNQYLSIPDVVLNDCLLWSQKWVKIFQVLLWELHDKHILFEHDP